MCEACRQSIMHSMKASENGEPYQLRWQENKMVSACCVPSCSSVDIKAEKHEFTWDMICESIGIASIESPGDISLCTKHYQQVYRMLDARACACKPCGVLIRNCKQSFISCPDPERVESFLWDTV